MINIHSLYTRTRVHAASAIFFSRRFNLNNHIISEPNSVFLNTKQHKHRSHRRQWVGRRDLRIHKNAGSILTVTANPLFNSTVIKRISTCTHTYTSTHTHTHTHLQIQICILYACTTQTHTASERYSE